MQIKMTEFLKERRKEEDGSRKLQSASYSLNIKKIGKLLSIIENDNPEVEFLNRSQQIDFLIHLLGEFIDGKLNLDQENLERSIIAEKEVKELKNVINEDLLNNFNNCYLNSKYMPHCEKYIRDKYGFEYKQDIGE